MQAQLEAIKLIILDVDGVLADGSITYCGSEQEIKQFNVQDGFGITMARQAGLQTAILTGRVSEPVARRAKELKFDFYEAGHFNKREALLSIMQRAGCSQAETLYMGDDVLDLVCFEHVGVFVAPSNAHSRVRQAAHITLETAGGYGAVREMIDCLLIAQGKLTTTENFFIEGKA